MPSKVPSFPNNYDPGRSLDVATLASRTALGKPYPHLYPYPPCFPYLSDPIVMHTGKKQRFNQPSCTFVRQSHSEFYRHPYIKQTRNYSTIYMIKKKPILSILFNGFVIFCSCYNNNRYRLMRISPKHYNISTHINKGK